MVTVAKLHFLNAIPCTADAAIQFLSTEHPKPTEIRPDESGVGQNTSFTSFANCQQFYRSSVYFPGPFNFIHCEKKISRIYFEIW